MNKEAILKAIRKTEEYLEDVRLETISISSIAEKEVREHLKFLRDQYNKPEECFADANIWSPV
jgi:hypothetical protein